MQRTIWEWLGIERTADKSRIRKAYAEQVKKYHPEEFPEEAQALREAYKEAMALASADRAEPQWADDDMAREVPFKGKEARYACANPVFSGPRPEPGAGVEPGYVFAKPVPPGMRPEPDAEAKYAYTKPVPPGMQPGPGAGVEPEYAYTKPAPPGMGSEPDAETEYAYTKSAPPGVQPGPGAGVEPEYAYTKPAPPDMQPEPGAGVEPEYAYTKPVPPSMVPEPGAGVEPEYAYAKSVPPGMVPEPGVGVEPEYSFVSPELPPGMAMRIDDLKKRLEAVYSTDHRNFAEKWRKAFLDYPYPRDLRDVRAVWEIFTVIEPMSRLRDSTWEILQTELFRFRKNTASWQLLQERFDAVRRSYNVPAEKPVDIPPKTTSLTEFCAAMLIVVTLLGSLTWVMDKAQDWKRQREIEEKLHGYQQLISEQIQLENPTVPISGGSLLTVFTEEAPCKVDINRDGLTDQIYYDPQSGVFMVKIYDSSTNTYNVYGSADQFVEDYPECSKGVLSYFTGGGK